MKIPKELMIEIRAVAAELPRFMYSTDERTMMSGKELMLTGVTEIEGKKLEADKIYEMTHKAYYEIRHARRMKRAYIREMRISGDKEKAYQAIKDYITGCIVAEKNMANEN